MFPARCRGVSALIDAALLDVSAALATPGGLHVGEPGARRARLDPRDGLVLSAPRQAVEGTLPPSVVLSHGHPNPREGCVFVAWAPPPTRRSLSHGHPRPCEVRQMTSSRGQPDPCDVVERAPQPLGGRVESAAKLERLGRLRDARTRVCAQRAGRVVRGSLAGRAAGDGSVARHRWLRLWRCGGRSSDIPSSPSRELGSGTGRQRRTRTTATIPR